MTTSALKRGDFHGFSKEYQYWVEHHHSGDRLLENIRKRCRPDSVVLDAGCGGGMLSVGLAPYVDRVVGIDIEPKMLSLARHKAQNANVDNLEFLMGDLEHLPVSDQAFDIVISSYSLHQTSIECVLPRLAKVVKPGGWLFLQEPTCPVEGPLQPLWYRWQGLRAAAGTLRRYGVIPAWHTVRFQQRRDWIEHQVESNHWDIVKWREVIERCLPGAMFQYIRSKTLVMALWQRELPQKQNAPGDEHDFSATDKPTQVARAYPLPSPDDYVPFPRSALESSVVDRFEKQVVQHEDCVALRTRQLDLSYGQLNSSANRIARRILSCRAGKNTPVAILMDQDDPVIAAILGILKTGRPYVAVDPADTTERQARILSKAGVEVLITTAARLATVNGIPDGPSHRLVWEELNDGSDANLELAIGPDTLAALFFTSGSTGEPKGVARDHRQFLHSTWANTNAYYVSSSDRNTLLYFPGFTASVPNIYDSILNGATLCSLNPNGTTISALLDWLYRERITHFNPSVGLWRQLVNTMPNDVAWPDLRLITLGGEAINGRDARYFQSVFGVDTALLYTLAMTEAGAVTHGYIDHTTRIGDGSILAGYALPDKEVIILDENDVPLPSGETGRIAVSSPYLSLGYWQDEERTVDTFHPAADGSPRRTFITGDVGCLHPDGCLEHYGRADSIVKVRGYRVNTNAIEAALREHSNIAQAAVVVRKRPDGHASLIAYLANAGADQISTDALHDYLTQSLSHFMIPERFIWLDALPLLSNGKINRQALSGIGTARPEITNSFVAPRTKMERQIAVIWAELLEVENVGINDSFFDLGGDSLMAMTMVQQVEQQLMIKAPSDVLKASTVSELARLLSGNFNSIGRPAMLPHNLKPPLRQTIKYRLRNRLRKMFRTGPVFNGFVLPYESGIRLQRTLATQQWVFNWIFSDKMKALRRWQQHPDMPHNHETATISILSNTWKKWRAEALLQSDEFGFGKWIVMHGDVRKFLISANGSKGVVFVLPHSVHIIRSLQKLFERHDRETAMVVRTSPNPTHQLAHHIQDRASQLWEARQVLLRKGVVFIAGDGLQGGQIVPVEFYGRRQPFRIGAAWLAVEHDASFVPIFTTMDSKGRVHVNLTPALIPKASNKEEQAIELTQQYGSLYADWWPRIYSSIGWKQLVHRYRHH